MGYLSSKKAEAMLGVCRGTLLRYAEDGAIEYIKTGGGQRRYDVDGYLLKKRDSSVICYCRVSSTKQRDDLQRQIERMRSIYPEAEIIEDIGSGLNFKRKGLRTILERLMRGHKLKIVVAHKDRLARFATELIRYLIERNGGELMVLDEDVGKSKDAELTEDLLAILHHFSCRMHGSRSNKSKIDQSVPEPTAKADLKEVVRGIKEVLQRCSATTEVT